MEENTGVNQSSSISDASESLSAMQGDSGVQDQQSSAPSGFDIDYGGQKYNITPDHVHNMINALAQYEQELATYRQQQSQTRQQPQQQRVDPNEPTITLADGRKVPMSHIVGHFQDSYSKLQNQYEQLRQERVRERAEAILTNFQSERGLSEEDMGVVIKTMVDNGITNPKHAYMIAFGDKLADMEVNKLKATLSNITPTGRGFSGKTDEQMTTESILEAASKMSF